jgi:hypothetical protein
MSSLAIDPHSKQLKTLIGTTPPTPSGAMMGVIFLNKKTSAKNIPPQTLHSISDA